MVLNYSRQIIYDANRFTLHNMNLAVTCLALLAVYIFPVASSAETNTNFVINVTTVIGASVETLKSGLRRYGFDPMELIDASETNFKGIPIIKCGTLYGCANFTLCGDWNLRFNGDGVRSGGRVCADKITGKFDYTDGRDSRYGKCLLDVTMTGVAADMDVLYSQSKKALSDPRLRVVRVSNTQMFLDECGPNFKRTRLPKNLENAYKAIILQQGVITSVELGKKANKQEPVVSFYNKFVPEMREKATAS